jgi:hypothetical protein
MRRPTLFSLWAQAVSRRAGESGPPTAGARSPTRPSPTSDPTNEPCISSRLENHLAALPAVEPRIARFRGKNIRQVACTGRSRQDLVCGSGGSRRRTRPLDEPPSRLAAVASPSVVRKGSVDVSAGSARASTIGKGPHRHVRPPTTPGVGPVQQRVHRGTRSPHRRPPRWTADAQ